MLITLKLLALSFQPPYRKEVKQMNDNTERLKPLLIDYIREVTTQGIMVQEHLLITLIATPTNALRAVNTVTYSRYTHN